MDTPGATSAVGSPSELERVQRPSVHGAVLADLERREVEPERRHLPAQLGDLAPGDPPETVVDERVLDLAELGVEGAASS